MPERFPLRVDLPAVTRTIREFGLIYGTHLGIADGQFLADVALIEGEIDIYTLRNLVEQDIRTTIDLIGYQNGFAYDVEVISAVCRDTGERCIFGVVVPALSERRGGVFATAIDAALLSAIEQEAGARIALANFRQAIRIPVDSGFFCYRAIEALMQSMRTNDSEKDSVVWDRFRNMLQVERSALDYIKGHADIPRHGRPSAIQDIERATVFRLTDEIVRRYLEYLTRRKAPLPSGEFPALEG